MTRRVSAVIVISLVLAIPVLAGKKKGPAAESTPVQVTGILLFGVKAPGGETTGITVTTNKGTYELDLGKNPGLYKLAAMLHGMEVHVAGKLWFLEGVKVPLRSIITVTSLKPAPPPPPPPYDTPFLTDQQLEDFNSMNAAQIRAFLAARNSYFRQPIADVDGVTFDPPVVIFNAAQTYRVNPKVILCTLQKEASGVTRTTRPPASVMGFLMGCVRPSTAREQLTCAAERFSSYHERIIRTGSTISGWRVGVPKLTQDGVWVTPATRAVAGQFTYTPYAGVQWGGTRPGVGGVYLFYAAWQSFGF